MNPEKLNKEEIEKKAKEFFDPKFKEFAELYLEGGDPPGCYGTGSPYYFCTICPWHSTC